VCLIVAIDIDTKDLELARARRCFLKQVALRFGGELPAKQIELLEVVSTVNAACVLSPFWLKKNREYRYRRVARS